PPVMVKGYKTGTFLALVSLGCTLLSFALTVPLSKLLASLITTLSFNSIVSLIQNSLAALPISLSDLFVQANYVESFVGGVLTSFLSVILFGLLFLIFLIVTKVVMGSVLRKKLERPQSKVTFRLGGLGIRLVDALLVAFLFLAPIYTALGGGVHLLNRVSVSAQENFDQPEITQMTETVDELCDPLEKHPLVVLGRVPVLNFTESVFGSFRCDAEKYNVSAILYDGADIMGRSMSVLTKDLEEYGAQEVEALNEILEITENNTFFYGVICDVMNVASHFVDEMEEEDSSVQIVAAVLEPFKGCTVSDVKDGARTLVELLDCAIRNDVLKNTEDSGALLKAVAKGAFIDEAIPLLRADELLSGTVDRVLLIALDELDFSNENEGDAELQEAIDTVKENVEEQIKNGDLDVEREVAAFKTVAAGLSGLQDAEEDGMTLETLNAAAISDVLTGLGAHPYIGAHGAKTLLKAFLPTFGGDRSILTDDFMDKALAMLVFDVENFGKEVDRKFENLLFSVQNLSSAVTNATGATGDDEKLNNTVESLLTDMSTDSADIIAEAISKDVMESMNKNGASSENADSFVQSLVVNMAEFEAKDNAELQKERDAIVDMNRILLDSGNKVNGNDSVESAVGGDLKGFLDQMSESTVITDTVGDTFEAHPDKNSDPAGFFASMSEQDKEDVKTAGNALLTEKPENSKNIKLLCLFMGVEL
ncbi:MAG: hypothetical protein IJX08_06955, partial [Clostridia bacterium]|nr:hypothetical protein [Clostridia bacterium]